MQRRENIIGCILVLFLFFAYQRYWYTPAKANLAVLANNMATASASLEKNRQAYKALSVHSPETANVNHSRHLASEIIKANLNLANIVMEFTQPDNEHPFVITKMLTEKQSSLDQFIQTQFTIELEGTFIAIGKFIERLEDSPLLTEVNSVLISRTGNELKKCAATIGLLVYTERE